MNGNTHYDAAATERPQLTNEEVANEHYLGAEGITDETMQFSALNRISEATLALAYEQRTASLISLFQLGKENLSEFFDATALDHTDRDALAQQIATRLGLNETSKDTTP